MTFVVAYAPTDTQTALKKHSFWTASDRVVKNVPGHEQLFVLMDANARTGRRGGGDLGVGIVESSAPTTETRSMTTVSDYLLSLPTMALHL